MKLYKRNVKIILLCVILSFSAIMPAVAMMGPSESPINTLLLLTNIPKVKFTSLTINIGSDFNFTEDIYETLNVVADNVVIDGNGYTLQGTGSGWGIVTSRRNVTIKNVVIKGWYYGINLNQATDAKIINNTIMNNYYCGIMVHRSENCILSGNDVAYNDPWGITLQYSSDNNNITGNSVTNNKYGIRLVRSMANRVIGNNIEFSSDTGLLIAMGSDNSIYENTVRNNRRGIDIYSGSYNNIIYHNNLIDNILNGASTIPGTNYWYHPGLLEGNYWSDYTGVDDGSGTDKHAIAGDGIGDTDIPWPSANYDFYPYINEDGWKKTLEEKLMEEVIADLATLEESVDTIDCWLVRIILSWLVDGAEYNMETALDLYQAGNATCAEIRVWITKCHMCLSEFTVEIADIFDAIEDELADDMLVQIDNIQIKLDQILDLL